MRRSATSRLRGLAAVLALAAGAVAVPRPTVAQTPYTALGLGYPVPPLDARAAALGSVGVGLLEGSFTIRNPADMVSFEDASLSATLAPEGVTVRGGERETSAGRSRMSVVRAVVPLGEWRASLGFGSLLDQDWAVRRQDTLYTSTATYAYDELRENDGGLSAIDLGVARRVGALSMGLSGQRLSGSVRQAVDRRFTSALESGGEPLDPVQRERSWSYGGWRLTAGAGLDVSNRLRLSASYAWSGEIEAERDDGSETRDFSMPSELAAGMSALATDDWLLTAGAGRTTWSDAAPDLDGDVAKDGSWAGAGIEFRGWSPADLPVRLRLGGRVAELPFQLPGHEQAVERALSVGLGSSFAGGRSALDLAIEFGSRGSVPETGSEESFTRFTLTATVHQ